MKTDRFVKVMLVIIAGLLFLNCVKDVSFTNSNSPTNAPTTSRNESTQSPNPTKTSTIPFIESSVEAASAPAFIQVGKSYKCSGLISVLDYGEKVTRIDSNSGWIEVEGQNGGGKSWVNTTNLTHCTERNPNE